MKRLQPIEIDFLEFFKTGKFDFLELGQTKEFILTCFPEPKHRFDEKQVKEWGADVWLYGSIELHFYKKELIAIFSDHFNHAKLSGGKHIKIKPWIFKNASQLTLQFVIAELNTQNIDFKKKTDNLGILLRLQSGIELTFEKSNDIDDVNPNDFQLSSFSLIEESAHRWK